MEKTLSQAQRDQLLMNTAKEDLIMKKKMMRSFEQSNKTLEESISKMTECLTSIGDGTASGMRTLAMALSNPPPTTGVPRAPQVYYPHFNTYSGFASLPSYVTPSSRSSLHSQFNRIDNEEVTPQSIPGRGPSVGATGR